MFSSFQAVNTSFMVNLNFSETEEKKYLRQHLYFLHSNKIAKTFFPIMKL